MNPADVFSSDVFRRIILPGIVLTVGVHPLMAGLLQHITTVYGTGSSAMVVVEIVVFGLTASSAIHWIYYVYEGFRLEWLTTLAGRINRWRVRRLQAEWQTIQGERDFESLSPREQARVSRIYEWLDDFPLMIVQGNPAEHVAERPTKSGNIIASYELYAQTRYGIDGTYFWDHLLNLATDAGRRDFEAAYSFAESLVLASFAGALVATLHLGLLAAFGVGALRPSLVLFSVLTGPRFSFWMVVFGLVVWLVFYQAALPAHREAGAALRATVDVTVPKLADWAKSVKAPLPEDSVRRISGLVDYLETLARDDTTPPDQPLRPTSGSATRGRRLRSSRRR
jgi:hypothetical protein